MHRLLTILMTAASVAIVSQCNAKWPTFIRGPHEQESQLENEIRSSTNRFNGREHFEEIEDEIVLEDFLLGMPDRDESG